MSNRSCPSCPLRTGHRDCQCSRNYTRALVLWMGGRLWAGICYLNVGEWICIALALAWTYLAWASK